MTKFIILTIFKEMFENFLNTSIIKRTIDSNKLKVEVLDIRDFSTNKHKKVDDTPYGGGSGMLFSCEPLDLCLQKALKMVEQDNNYKILYMSPAGKLLNYDVVNEFSKTTNEFIIICGHYEGIDERIIKKYNIEEISIGDFVLTGGELPAMVFIDSLIRLKNGVLSENSIVEESHTNVLLEYPQYTKPYLYDGYEVPDVLVSGDHKKIAKYRKDESIYKTYINRPDLIQKAISLNIIKKQDLENVIIEKGGKNNGSN